MPEISIIILTLNSISFIKSCLDSIFSQNYDDLEVIVVDNGSEDGTSSFIKKDYPQVILIENSENLGAARARNQGIEIAKGIWILTLDCDVVLKDDFFKSLMYFLNKLDTSIGMVQPKILNLDKKTLCSCGIYLSRLRRFYDIGKGKTDNGEFNTSQYIFGACSAAALYRRQMLEELREDSGYFDERFFFLVEDVDLAWRAQKKNWKALYYSETACYHIGNSSNYTKKERQYLCYRNRYYSIVKNDGFANYLKKISPILFYDLPRLLYLIISNPYIIWKKL